GHHGSAFIPTRSVPGRAPRRRGPNLHGQSRTRRIIVARLTTPPRASATATSGEAERKKPSPARSHPSSGGELRAGVRVRHARYGVGVVLRTEGSGED